jgi:hypothetical protein
MKPPRAIKLVAPKVPTSPAVSASRRSFGSPGLFAYHPPAVSGNLRMTRPKGGKGPRNVTE